MVGTFINMGAIVAGAAVGTVAGSKLPEKMRQTVLYGIGLVLLVIGVQMSMKTQNTLIVLGAILIGGVIGEALRLEDRVIRLGELLQQNLSRGPGNSIAEGFATASLVFCVGPMAILGPIADGLSGDYKLLSIKAVMDAFIAIAFSASLGWSVSLAALSIFAYQGGITLFAGILSSALTEPMITEMTATGGLVIMGVGIKLLQMQDLRLANFVPSIAVAPVIVGLIPRIGAWF